MKTETMYARNEQTAQDWMNEYFLDHTLIDEGTCNCGCGESRCYNYYGNADVVTRVIICESCHDQAAFMERV